MLRAIAVVYIPIEYQYFFETVLFLQVTREDGDVIKQAKTQCHGTLRVMTGRPDHAEAVVYPSIHDSVCHCHGAAGGLQGNIV